VLLKFDVFEDRISLTAWHEGDAMPLQPQLMVVDGSFTFGSVGVGVINGNASSRVAFRHFAAVPEPSAVALGVLGTGSFGGFALLRRRRLD
jgi:hypothetical protein